MADQNDDVVDATSPESSAAGGESSGDGARVVLATQYLKSLTFENAGAPESLSEGSKPTMNVTINVGGRTLNETFYESVLKLSATAKRGDRSVFSVEASYAGLYEIRGLESDRRDRFLFIESPRLLFPFARRVFADATRDGGMPPLLLAPPDFAAMYEENLRRGRAPKVDAPSGGDESSSSSSSASA